MKATTLISALAFATAAFAQASQPTSTSANSAAGAKSSTASTATSSKATPTGSYGGLSKTSESLIPSSISTNCSDFLTSLNTDTAIGTEFNQLANALSAFSGGGGSYSDLSGTLTTLCAIDSSAIRVRLTEFKDKCSEELIGANSDPTVIADYDTLYVLAPFKDAICAKPKASEEYCLLNKAAGASATTTTANNATTTANNTPTPKVRRKRAQTFIVPDAGYYASNYIPFLYTSPDLDAGDLCTPCTQSILSKYVAFQNAQQHALGATNRPLLSRQVPLFNTITDKCGETFVSEIDAQANVKSAEKVNTGGASPTFAGSIFTAVAGALVAVMALI